MWRIGVQARGSTRGRRSVDNGVHCQQPGDVVRRDVEVLSVHLHVDCLRGRLRGVTWLAAVSAAVRLRRLLGVVATWIRSEPPTFLSEYPVRTLRGVLLLLLLSVVALVRHREGGSGSETRC